MPIISSGVAVKLLSIIHLDEFLGTFWDAFRFLDGYWRVSQQGSQPDHMGVSINGGTSKWLVYKKIPAKVDDLGYLHFRKPPYDGNYSVWWKGKKVPGLLVYTCWLSMGNHGVIYCHEPFSITTGVVDDPRENEIDESRNWWWSQTYLVRSVLPRSRYYFQNSKHQRDEIQSSMT